MRRGRNMENDLVVLWDSFEYTKDSLASVNSAHAIRRL
jgi:hypothetical protein